MAALTESQRGHLATRLDSAGVTELRPLPGGASSLTFAGTLAQRAVVVKMAPPGMAPTHHRDILRQARIIRALGPTALPVPEVLWDDEGDPPEVPPLFIMSFLPGTSLEPLFDLDAAGEQDTTIAARFFDAVRTMAQLHRLVPSSIGLADEPVVGVEAEIDRWCRLFETIDSALVPGWHGVENALRTAMPAALPPAIVHGDFRLGNLLADGGQITAVIDWEIWSIGDPRIDVGWFLINADPATYSRATPYAGSTPPPSALATAYTTALGRDISDLNWFQGLACFKSAATWALIVKRNRRRTSPEASLEAMSQVLPSLLARATAFLTDFTASTSPDGG